MSTPPPPPTSPSPSLVETLFQRSLSDLIKSLRAAPTSSGESLAVARASSEILRELRSSDPQTKSAAVEKAIYLSSLHFTAPPAAFPVLELLASAASPAAKRAAYLAASLSFHPSSTDLLPLATHQLRKDISLSTNIAGGNAVASMALHLLASAASPDLAAHLASDVVPLVTRVGSPIHSKAVAAATRALLLAPSAAVPLLFKSLVDCLASPDPRAVTAAVSAFCELSAPPADPAPFLPLAPEFYKVLLNSRSNWAVIKVLKIFSRLAPLEPRLAARLVDPLCQMLRRSAAVSLVFECVRTVLLALPAYDAAVRLAVEKVKEFLGSPNDPNLRLLGLKGLGMLGPEYMWALNESQATIARSLSDLDPNIRTEALKLMMGMVSESNVVDVAALLVSHAAKSDPEFASNILSAVLQTCGRNVYEMVADFDWYVGLLGEMVRCPYCAQGEEIARQLVDIGLRVRDARPELVRVARNLLIDPLLLGNPSLSPVLSAAAWISGEYVEFSKDLTELVEALVQPRTSLLPASARAVYIQSVFKVLSTVGAKDVDLFNSVENSDSSQQSASYLLDLIEKTVGPLTQCDVVEVQERAHNVLGLASLLRMIHKQRQEAGGLLEDVKTIELIKFVRSVFTVELGPVSANAQKRVTPPEGLSENLDALADFMGKDAVMPTTISFYHRKSDNSVPAKEDSPEIAAAASNLVEHRRRNDLYYLPVKSSADVNETNEYPHVPDPLVNINSGEINGGLAANLQKKTKPRKLRPVVVKLDEDVKTLAPRGNAAG